MSKKFWTSFRIRWQTSEKSVENLVKCLVILSVWKQTLLCSSISWALCLLMVYHDTEKFELPTKSQALVLGIFVCNVFISDTVTKAKCLLLLKICWSCWIEGEVDLSKSIILYLWWSLTNTYFSLCPKLDFKYLSLSLFKADNTLFSIWSGHIIWQFSSLADKEISTIGITTW